MPRPAVIKLRPRIRFYEFACLISCADIWLCIAVCCSELADLADLEIPDDEVPDFGHVWQKDPSPEECADCDTMVDTWCKHCEACKYCNDNGRGHACPANSMAEEV